MKQYKVTFSMVIEGTDDEDAEMTAHVEANIQGYTVESVVEITQPPEGMTDE